jgi:hypothetical protein
LIETAAAMYKKYLSQLSTHSGITKSDIGGSAVGCADSRCDI